MKIRRIIIMVPILINLSIVLSLVGAKTVNNLNTPFSISREQTEILAASVCDTLGFMFDIDDMETAAACPSHFLDPSNGPLPPPEVKVRCRSRETVVVEVTPSDNFQLVVLIPKTPGEGGKIAHTIVDQGIKFVSINIPTASDEYVIYATVLDNDIRPTLWLRKDVVPAWYKVPVPELKKYDVKVQYKHANKSAAVAWNHTGDSDVCFVITNNCTNGSTKAISIWPDLQHQVVFENLPYGVNCTVEVKGFYGSTKITYQTSAQKELKPEVPIISSIEAAIDGDAWKVRVKWAKPRSPQPDVYYLILEADDNQTMDVPGSVTEAVFSDVTGEGLYSVEMYSYYSYGVGHTYRRALFPPRRDRRWVGWAGATAGAWTVVALAALGTVLCRLRRRHAHRHMKKLMLPPVSKPGGDLEPLEPESEDRWEIKSERLLLHEVIGEGAFGVVRRGSLAPNLNDVAVKMLKDFPTQDEVRTFRLEMELMKSVGAHPHVVSLVGCCSNKRPLIVAEYCARGDLLSFLRCSWDKMLSKRNAKYYNNYYNDIDSPDYRNDLFKCSIQKEHSRLVVNRMYDLQNISETDLTPRDLLSFCRQIAMGMKFLAANRLVHRDLAARNVLVTADRTLKIADFGLSRDVYEENQYKQKGNGKMPVKWMALESLTRRIYTSQSDVWSFGVVVWEVVTVGASPYPEIHAARLPRILRAGYRMPRPPNCSKQLYELMLSCWRAHPRERPSFGELHQRLDELLHSACVDDYLCLELDEQAPPRPRKHRYLQLIMRGKRAWTRETYERPLKAVQVNHNHYTSPPVTLKAPV